MYTSVALVYDELRQHGETTLDDADDRRYVLDAIDDAAARMDQKLGDTFAPSIETVHYTAAPVGDRHHDGDIIDSTLMLARSLMTLTSITIDDTVIDPALFRLLPRTETYSDQVMLLNHGSWCKYTTDPEDAIAVVGTWGRGGGWIGSGDTLGAELLDTALTASVADADGADVRNRSPRFSPGMLIRIGDEYIQVRAVDVENDTITLFRAQRGTAAATHALGTAIDVWYPDRTIARAAMRFASFLYRRQGEYATRKVEGMTETSYPKEMPDDVYLMTVPFWRIPRVRAVRG